MSKKQTWAINPVSMTVEENRHDEGGFTSEIDAQSELMTRLRKRMSQDSVAHDKAYRRMRELMQREYFS